MTSLDSPPARKRQRLSSPSYQESLGDLSQEDLRAVDEIEARYSQGASQPADSARFPGFGSARTSLFTSASSLHTTPLATGFASARDIPLIPAEEPDRPPSPDAPQEPDYDAWFDSTAITTTVGFQTAKSVTGAPAMGFKTASGKGVIAPSAGALEKARKWMKADEPEEGPSMSQASTSTLPEDDSSNPFVSTTTEPQRPILRSVENGFAPSTPTPAGAGFSRASGGNSLFKTPAGLDKSKAFKPPLMARNNVQLGNTHAVSPLNPKHSSAMFQTPAKKPQHPLASTSVASAAFRTPARAAPAQLPRLGLTPLKGGVTPGSTVKKFSTPFKAGMRPGEVGRMQLQKKQEAKKIEQIKPALSFSQELAAQPSTHKGKGKERAFFDLSTKSNRQTLASSGLQPQSYTGDDLESMGIPFSELSQITPDLALYYCFHSSPPDDNPTMPVLTLGPTAALDELLRLGCSLATKPWVENHWGLILWKLAGMVCLDPDRENNASARRWCWNEVINQFLYRYERELNGGVRPPLRLIASKDSPASSPMVLCVSKITWSEGGITDGGVPILPFPQLEVTDGWYRMRVEVDEALARAVRRRVIRVGRKIAVVDARLSSARKEPYDILEAYEAISLKISGNSSHLAPWHAKLGFQKSANVSTLHSLTPDGGSVAVMNLVITKVYPVAYLEFVEGEDGKKHRQGPRNEKDENTMRDRWKTKRETEESKLRFTMEKRLSRWEAFADRMEQKAGARFLPTEDDGPPDSVDDAYDQLENASTPEASVILGRLNYKEAGWLARLIREKILKEREQSREEFESELNDVCPPREVRDFRVIVARDLRTQKKPGNRFAQITVWNVLNLVFNEGEKSGALKEGQKFFVTNLVPTQQGAWMTAESDTDSEIYLSTRRDSRWTKA